MNTGSIWQYLDSLLPNEKVIQDMVNYTWGNENREVEVEVEDKAKMVLPKPLPIEVVTKASYQEYFEIGFGTGYRVLAALGGIKEIKFGVVYPTYCFMLFHELQRPEILHLAAPYGANNLRLFGSVARGEATPQSDIDCLVDLPPSSLLTCLAFRQDLETLIGTKVDVVTERSLPEYLRPQIFKEAIPL